MQIILSLCEEPDSINNCNNFFVIYDTDKRKVLQNIKLKGMANVDNATRGTGMCYLNNFWYGIILAKEHRVASRLIAIDTKTGKRSSNKLMLSKSVHCIYPYCQVGSYTYLLANSTQNDIVSLITLRETDVLTEDVFFDFLTNEERSVYKWEEEYIHDDSFHNNSVFKYNNKIFVSMFLDYKIDGSKKIKDKHWRRTEIDKVGAIHEIRNDKLIYNNCMQPHSFVIDSRENMLFCDSGTFKLVNITNNTQAQCNGFTRGLCEDKKRKGYWVGLSQHRKLNTGLKGAAIQFVSYDMQVEKYIDLSSLGKEVFDILPYKEGRYNG